MAVEPEPEDNETIQGVVEVLRAQLSDLKLKALRKRARVDGVDSEILEDAIDWVCTATLNPKP